MLLFFSNVSFLALLFILNQRIRRSALLLTSGAGSIFSDTFACRRIQGSACIFIRIYDPDAYAFAYRRFHKAESRSDCLANS